MRRSASGAPVVVVTGASAGIGRATCLELARRGCSVVAAARSAASLETLRDEVATTGGTVRPVVLDVRDPGSRQALADRLAADGVQVDVLVNNAGVAVSGPLLEADLNGVRDLFETNTFGLLALTQLLARPMVQRRRGRVVNVSSTAGRFAGPMTGAYSASKFALEALSDALRLELVDLGVDVVIVEPGAVSTGFAERSVEQVQIDPGGPYAGLIPEVPRLVARSQAGAVSAERVAATIADAVLTPSPRARYVAPAGARAMVTLARLLPTRTMDGLLRRVGGLVSLAPPPA